MGVALEAGVWREECPNETGSIVRMHGQFASSDTTTFIPPCPYQGREAQNIPPVAQGTTDSHSKV